jgi:hypothetical protein
LRGRIVLRQRQARQKVFGDRQDRMLAIGEAVLLSVVTIVAAWSG